MAWSGSRGRGGAGSGRADARERREKRQALLEPGAVVRAVTPDAKDPTLVHVRVGRRSAAKIDAEAATRLGVEAGCVLDAALIAEILREQGVTDARYWATRAVARAPISKGMLLVKLQRRSVPAEAAQRVVGEFELRGWLDDRRFAEGVVASELGRKPAGARLLEAKLRAKRVDGRIAAEVVRVALGERRESGVEEFDEALRLAEKKARTLSARLEPEAVRRRIYGLLARRGFDPETCGRVVREVVRASEATES